MRDGNVFDGVGPEGGCFHVYELLLFPGAPFYGAVYGGEGGDVGEARDAEDAGGAEVEGACGGGVSRREGFVALGG